jgi:PhoH-like ATPase
LTGNHSRPLGGNILEQKHIYILDTCVLLHDPKSLFKFQNNDVYIPLAVIDDLDDQKTRKEAVAAAAREVFRQLKPFDFMTSEGAVVNEQGGRLFIYNHEKKDNEPSVNRVNSDHAVITSCWELQKQFPDRKVSIVTKDTGLKFRAIGNNCNVENYLSDLVNDTMYTGIRYVETNTVPYEENLDIEFLNKELRDGLNEISPNEFVVFKSPEGSDSNELTKYRHWEGKLIKINKPKAAFMGITPRNLEQDCAMSLLMDTSVPLVCLSGKAGSGKTILALASAMEQINEGIYDKLIVMKPVIPVGGKDIGALPGDKFEKLAPWLGPISDNFTQLCGNFGMHGVTNFEEAVKDKLIEVEAMAYIQGRSIPRSVILVDEAQNLTPREARMVVERCGEGSKIMMLGDISQIENPYLDKGSCGLAHAMNGARKQSLCGAVLLKTVTRSPLAAIAGDIFSSPEAQGR